MKIRYIAAACVGLFAIHSFLGAPALADTIVVTPSDMGDWSFDNRDANGTVGLNSTGSGALVSGPATPPLGIGSANLSTGNGTSGGDGAEELRNTGYNGTLVSDITSLSYSTYVTQNNGSQFPYLGLVIDPTGQGNPADYETIFFEPQYQTGSAGSPLLPNQTSIVLDTWQSWNALDGGWWDTNGSCNPGSGVGSLSQCLGNSYNTATIVNSGGLGGVRFDAGFASPTDKFNGYVDDITVGIGGQNTSFDFEAGSSTAPACPFARDVTVSTAYNSWSGQPTTMAASFNPGIGLSAAAAECGFKSFDWVQTIETFDYSNPLGHEAECDTADCSSSTTLTSADAPFNDPPANGYTYCNPSSPTYTGTFGFNCANAYPYYYDPSNIMTDPDYCVTTNGVECVQTEVSDNDETLNFFDYPKGINATFETELVGVLDDGSYQALFPWTWTDTFTGISILPIGGISETESNDFIDPLTGTGGVTVLSVNGQSVTVPEPPTLSILLAGMLGSIGGSALRRRRKPREIGL